MKDGDGAVSGWQLMMDLYFNGKVTRRIKNNQRIIDELQRREMLPLSQTLCLFVSAFPTKLIKRRRCAGP